MTTPMPDLAQDALPPTLELQLMLGNGIEALVRLSGGAYDEGSLTLLRDLSVRFERAAEELAGTPRTLAQSATAVGVTRAAQRAFSGTAPRDQLLSMASELRRASEDASLGEAQVEKLVSGLDRLHGVLVSARSTPSDEVKGLRRLA